MNLVTLASFIYRSVGFKFLTERICLQKDTLMYLSREIFLSINKWLMQTFLLTVQSITYMWGFFLVLNISSLTHSISCWKNKQASVMRLCCWQIGGGWKVHYSLVHNTQWLKSGNCIMKYPRLNLVLNLRDKFRTPSTLTKSFSFSHSFHGSWKMFLSMWSPFEESHTSLNYYNCWS